MDMKQIKELMAAMEKTGLKKVRIKEEKGYEIELERGGDHPHPPAVRHHEVPHHFVPSLGSPPVQRPEAEAKKGGKAEGNFVNSPMVGTFYAAPSPEDPPYVKAGDEVTEDTVICIVEAMKVMNEVKAGKKGKIAEILVENGEPIEFGTPLFRIV